MRSAARATGAAGKRDR